MRGDIIAHSSTAQTDQPKWLKDRLEWFRSLQFGIIIHWGIYAFWDCCESWPLVPEDEWARNPKMKCWKERNYDLKQFQLDYWNLNKQFNPTKFDPEAWADSFAAAGAKYVCFTTKHHDGFCMWDTATTDYKITGPDCPFHTNPKADVTRHLFDALRDRGLGVSVYFSKADWHCPYYWSPNKPIVHRGANTLDDPATWEKFVKYTHEQIRELMSNYGKIDILWLDAGWVAEKEDIRMPELVEMARALQPGLLVANRTVGDFEDFVTPEREIPDQNLGIPWEACLPLGSNWKYVEGEGFKTATEVRKERETINSRGGNFLLGLGPKPDGTFPEEVLALPKEL
jgi:alpha-L-fucosidase